MKAIDDFGGLIRLPALQDWMDSVDLPGIGPITSIERLTGGTQNEVFLITRGSERMVLRRPAQHANEDGNRTMMREARLLKALGSSDVPHPHFLAASDDHSILGASFYLMEPLEGFSPRGPLPGEYAKNPSWRNEMALAMVSAEAKLAAVDYCAVGLADFGKADRWHERQPERWLSQLESCKKFPGFELDPDLDVELIARWLSDNIPDDRRIGVIHGDPNWQNAMFRFDRPEISGLIDWELSTLGDPMLDLAWMLTSWWSPGDPEGHIPLITPWQGFPTREELVKFYCELTGRSVDTFQWMFVLACYKLGIVMQRTYARSLVGQVVPQEGLRFKTYARRLLIMASNRVASP